MEVTPLSLIVPSGTPGTGPNLQAAVNQAVASKAAVWIRADYAGSDTYTNPNSVPVFDMRGAGTQSFGGGITSVASLPATCTSPASVYLSVASGSNAVGYYDCASNGTYVFRAAQTAWRKVGPVIFGGTTDASSISEPGVFITPVPQVVTNSANGAPVLGMFPTSGFTTNFLV